MSWFEEEKLWLYFYDWMFPEKSFQQAREQTDEIIQLSGISSGKILDLCCGPGRFSIPFSDKGFKVTGVDLQQVLLEKATLFASRENQQIEFIEDDMLSFKREETFDLIISMFSSFGYFKNRDEDLIVLKNAYQSLRENGKILIDVRGKEIHAMANISSFSQEMPGGDLIIHRTKVSDGWTKSLSEWIYIKQDIAHKFKMEFNLYSASELKSMLELVGFSNIQIFGDLAGSPYDHNAQRLIAISEKK